MQRSSAKQTTSPFSVGQGKVAGPVGSVSLAASVQQAQPHHLHPDPDPYRPLQSRSACTNGQPFSPQGRAATSSTSALLLRVPVPMISFVEIGLRHKRGPQLVVVKLAAVHACLALLCRGHCRVAQNHGIGLRACVGTRERVGVSSWCSDQAHVNKGAPLLNADSNQALLILSVRPTVKALLILSLCMAELAHQLCHLCYKC